MVLNSKLIPNTRCVLGLLIMLVTTVAGQTLPAKAETPFDFKSSLKELQEGSVSSLSLAALDSIPMATIMHEKLDERDQRRHPYGHLNPRFLQDITMLNIQEVSENYVLLAVKDQFGQWRALSITPEGEPIECILLYDHFYYGGSVAHESESRRFSPSTPYFYDRIRHEFVFSTIFKIVSPEEGNPLMDLNFHEDETTNICRVAVSEQGRFSSARIEQVNSNRIEFAQFTVATSFLLEHIGKPLKEIDLGGNQDTLNVYLDRDQSMQLLRDHPLLGALTLRLIPKEQGSFFVSQQYKSTFGISGDGDFCDLNSPVYCSKWIDLQLEYDMFDVAKYSVEKAPSRPQISVEDFKKLIKKHCGNYHYQFVKHVRTDEEVSSFYSISEIVLKIVFQSNAGGKSSTTYLIFELAKGC